MSETITMHGVRDHCEEYPVELERLDKSDCPRQFQNGHGRIVIVAYNEGRCNCTEIDLLDLLDWLKRRLPELLNNPTPEQAQAGFQKMREAAK